MDAEIWKPIAGYEGWYSVSSLGRVRSEDRGIPAKNRWGGVTVQRHTGRILKPFCVGKGYLAIKVSSSGVKQSNAYLHKEVMLSFVGPVPKGLIICHNDGDKLNNSLANLRYDTYSSNNYDAHRHKKARMETIK